MSKWIDLSNDEYEIVHSFPVLHQGWECDQEGHIIKRVETGKLFLALSSHGAFYLAKNKELEEKIEEYRNALKLSKQALVMIYNKNKDSNE